MSFEKKDVLKFSLFAFLFLGLVVAWLGFGERGFIHLYQMEKERAARLESIKQLDRQNKELLEEIERLRNDKDYVETLGRRKMGLIKEGETLYRFSEETAGASAKQKEAQR